MKKFLLPLLLAGSINGYASTNDLILYKTLDVAAQNCPNPQNLYYSNYQIVAIRTSENFRSDFNVSRPQHLGKHGAILDARFNRKRVNGELVYGFSNNNNKSCFYSYYADGAATIVALNS